MRQSLEPIDAPAASCGELLLHGKLGFHPHEHRNGKQGAHEQVEGVQRQQVTAEVAFLCISSRASQIKQNRRKEDPSIMAQRRYGA